MTKNTTLRQGTARRGQRRAVATGAVVAVLGTALVGGSLLLGPDRLPAAAPDTTAAEPAIAPAEPAIAPAEPAAVPANPAVETAVAVPASDQARGDDHAAADDPASAATPPWQDGPPPLPEGGMEPENPTLPNAWEIPDARPTGVGYLDSFGPPKMGMNYPRTVPLFSVMACNTDAEDVEPLAAQDWMYYGDENWADRAVDIVLTGWEDSAAARDALRDDTMTFCVRDVDGDWERLAWTGHEGDDDYLLYEAQAGGREHGFAVVRQGDYLIGVTVSDATGEDNAEAAAEIAGKTADNLEALDPVHGRD